MGLKTQLGTTDPEVAQPHVEKGGNKIRFQPLKGIQIIRRKVLLFLGRTGNAVAIEAKLSVGFCCQEIRQLRCCMMENRSSPLCSALGRPHLEHWAQC